TRQVKDLFHIDHFVHDLGLTDIPGNTIEHENIDIGFEFVGFDRGVDPCLPQLDRDIVGNKLAFAREFKEGATDFGPGIEGPKDVTTSAMKKARDRTDGAALGSLAAARGAEKKISDVFHSK